MTKRILAVFIAIIVMNVSILNIQGANTIIYETTTRQNVTKGLVYEYSSRFTKDGWVDIHVLIMDMDEEQVALELLESVGSFGLRDTMTGLAEQTNQELEIGEVVAGINGSFFNMSQMYTDPLGPVYNDEVYGFLNQNYNTLGHGVASLLQYENGDVNFDFLGATITFTNERGETLYIDGINKLAVGDYPIIYNGLIGEDTSQIDLLGNYYKVVIENSYVTEVIEPSETAILPDVDSGYIVAIPESLADPYVERYPVGTGVDLDIDTTIDTEDLKLAISGAGKVLENGEYILDGYIVYPESRQPRSAIGVTSDGSHLVAMVVDGRGSSIGATHEELGEYLLEYDVTDAIQLDGGGSSTMLARDLGYEDIEVQNQPSDGSQRKVLNGIGFITLSETGVVDRIQIKTSTQRVFMNNPIHLDVIGYDANYNPVNIDYKKLVWSVEGLKGTWETNVFIPSESGTGTLTCYYEGLTTKVELISLDSPIDLSISPRVLSLDNLESGSFTITGIDSTGYSGAIQKEDVTYVLDNPEIGSFEDGVFTAGNIDGISKVLIKMGNRVTSGYIAVGNEEATVEELESVSYYERAYPEESVSGSIEVISDIVQDTEQAYKFNYHFEPSIDPQAFYMMIEDFKFTSRTDYISLSVYGNASNHLLKTRIIDATGEIHTLTFSNAINWTGWKSVSVDLPSGLRYPIIMDRIYVVSMENTEVYDGEIIIDEMKAMKSIDTSTLEFDEDGFVDDPLIVNVKPKDTYEIRVFGPTSYRNRLLDNVILSKVYEQINLGDFGILAGKSDIDEDLLEIDYHVWSNSFAAFSVNKVKIIDLATASGGIRDTNYTQYEQLRTTLASTTENNIIIIGNKSPLTGFSDIKEGALLHDILKTYQTKTGKNIFYINAGGYTTNITIKDGIRYIDLSGLWYQVSDRYVDLNSTFYKLRFFVDGNDINYMLEPLYPVVEIN